MVSEREVKIEHFCEIQKKYYNDEIDDKELANEVTQPFWQSMRLTKRRIKAKGLRMDLSVQEIRDKRVNNSTQYTRVHRDGSDIIRECIQDVMTNRSFWSDGKKIYGKKEREICNIHTLKANVQEEEAACPNCGHVGKIADYIDGCDYCGSVFTVNDFETKVSGIFLEENITAKVKNILKGTAVLCGILGGLLFILTVLSFAGIILTDMYGNDDKFLVTNVVAMVFSANMLPVMWRTFIGIVVVYGIVGCMLLVFLPRQIIGERIVKTMIPEFSAQDFLQNLEYKMRNIHFADSAAEVEAFASCDMQDIVAKYKNVVECNMRKLQFINMRQDTDKYYLSAKVNLRLSLYNGNRIRNKYEEVNILVSGKKEVFLKNTMAIREYKCSNCHSSITLLNGGNCAYCGTRLDYENYSWLIDRYDNKIQTIHTYQWIKLAFIGVFLIIFLCNLSTADVVDNEVLELYEEVNQAEQALEEYFETVIKPEDAGLDVVLETWKKISVRQRSYDYSVDNSKDVARLYRERLEEAGYIYDEKSSTQKYYAIYMPVEYQGEKGYVKIKVSWDDVSHMIVEMNTVEFIGE